jgi:hypothetical protein
MRLGIAGDSQRIVVMVRGEGGGREGGSDGYNRSDRCN